MAQCLPVPWAASSHPWRASSEEEHKGKRLPPLVSSLLGFNLTGLHRSWAGFNPGLITAQLPWARSPPEEPLALPSPKHSLEGLVPGQGGPRCPNQLGRGTHSWV